VRRFYYIARRRVVEARCCISSLPLYGVSDIAES
jgi:hypothetical protein